MKVDIVFLDPVIYRELGIKSEPRRPRELTVAAIIFAAIAGEILFFVVWAALVIGFLL